MGNIVTGDDSQTQVFLLSTSILSFGNFIFHIYTKLCTHISWVYVNHYATNGAPKFLETWHSCRCALSGGDMAAAPRCAPASQALHHFWFNFYLIFLFSCPGAEQQCSAYHYLSFCWYFVKAIQLWSLILSILLSFLSFKKNICRQCPFSHAVPKQPTCGLLLLYLPCTVGKNSNVRRATTKLPGCCLVLKLFFLSLIFIFFWKIKI